VHEEGASALIYRVAADGADWRPVDRANALQEGWDLLPRGANPVVGNRPDRTIFSSDTEAMRHVQQSAAAGSEMHRRALAIHYTANSRYRARPVAADPPWTERLGDGARLAFPWAMGIGTFVLSWWLPPPVWVWVHLALRLLARFHH
jgi:hypothetical protein